jgi:hypothetical protein
MKKIFQFTIILIITSSLLFSCTKHKDDIIEPVPTASINFTSPLPGQIYPSADSVPIMATAIAKATIHGYDLRINKVNDTATCLFTHIHDHNDTLYINKKWKSSFTGPEDMEVTITLYLDHEGHTLVKKSAFKLN